MKLFLTIKETAKAWDMPDILSWSCEGPCNIEYWLAMAGEKSKEFYSF